ncbi:MAG: sigma-54 dependent transcriptional regulator, flagellar regulatory protein [Myxococcales bacterium]|jgi:sigma-54 specific flagellar transcriptional regulator A|nr:sigma-54 dependent transcriptional regulator, flagellar regulatory protein [Myxococcales bacterium]
MNLGTLRPLQAALASIRPLAPATIVDDGEITSIRRNVRTLRPTSRGKIIGQHPTIKKCLDTIDRVASSMATVLVIGESGTGKELVVAALHDASTRRHGPLVTINCGAIPAELVESELFGHVKGAFTGAQSTRRGHVANAEGGTLFLDEVGDLPLAAQVKLLRVLQQREYTPVGDSRAVKCDVRVVAATHRDLKSEVAAGRFREDLYYRLNVIQLTLPALRERGTDVRVLAMHFYRGFVASSGRTDLRGFSAGALHAIETHSWPGNVRALENAIERGVLLARGPFIEADDILEGGASSAVEANVALSPRDPRREPDVIRTVEIRESAHARSADARNSAEATALPPPPKAARFDLSRRPSSLSMPAVVPFGTPERRGSNPAFPRVLPDQGFDLFSAAEQYQNNLIRQALARTGGNKNKAAQLLGLNRTTLVEIIRRRGL